MKKPQENMIKRLREIFNCVLNIDRKKKDQGSAKIKKTTFHSGTKARLSMSHTSLS